MVYTMVEMAKAHGLNIYGYLKFLLEHRPGKDMTDEQLAELAPWSEKLQLTKGWGNFVSDRINIWRLQRNCVNQCIKF